MVNNGGNALKEDLTVQMHLQLVKTGTLIFNFYKGLIHKLEDAYFFFFK